MTVELPGGRLIKAGDGGEPKVHVRINDKRAVWFLVFDPEMALGELYMNRRLEVLEGTIDDLLYLCLSTSGGDRNRLIFQAPVRLRRWLRKLTSWNSIGRSRSNVAHHYDLDERFYRLFLDRDMQYSCAYFETPNDSLETAQLTKKRHITAKLALTSGMRVLDIGCGWGGLALYLSTIGQAGFVKGITLSQEQLAVARQRAEEQNLETVSFELEDYRHTQGSFDRIVSVGMFEHVGPAQYNTFFRSASNLLSESGVMLVHTIGRTGTPDTTNPWLTKYIFPGGHLPTLSEIVPAVEKSGLQVTDIEVLRLHYAETLKAWRDRFMATWNEAKAYYDERFCRMWEFYLAIAEASFRYEDLVVFQMQFTKNNGVLPVTRDYIAGGEEALQKNEIALFGNDTQGPSIASAT
ncbi:Cyclopropane-fatty-acyl-phospholipid synthase [Hartmannibacter diazotrophicus]|uniref:Cyclopropane-fatty-acyl-phospholipid synthase n=1 Tax=Hartmannibacter diazotrophicus TaxID=1482074 RepID=A0A2C9D474_9HYPH|nr:cyclopropane-fatty-acyl-phospholipid synthase family protein [Hartmannibacter diazotrophicus]SON55127.1 Cyclopropane-fatty-acyl-phospholipid synthase [Hartmannibacter diazotrophicus]